MIPGRSNRASSLAVCACLASLALHAPPVFLPMIVFDDFQILLKSRTWPDAWSNLWVPANEHAMPLGRLSTAALVSVAGRPTLYPFFAALQGPLATLLGMVFLAVFVRRETDSPFAGLLALILFGVTSVYQEAVSWFAASFSILAADTTLLGLLAAQWFRTTRLWQAMMACLVCCALAPCWFAGGILAGPLCGVYLLIPDRTGQPRSHSWRDLLVHVSAPLLGTALFLLVSLPRTAGPILHSAHYQGKTALEAFDPVRGMSAAWRSLVDGLVLGFFGVGNVALPVPLALIGLCVFTLLAILYLRPVRERRLLWLGLAFIFSSYLLVYSARAEWGYEQMVSWSRYQLLPQIGLTVVITGGLKRWPSVAAHSTLTPKEIRLMAVLLALCFFVQCPRAILYVCRIDPDSGKIALTFDPEQQEILRRVEAINTRCHQYHIDAQTARAALSPLRLPGCGENEDALEFLKGSDDPWAITVEAARRLLKN